MKGKLNSPVVLLSVTLYTKENVLIHIISGYHHATSKAEAVNIILHVSKSKFTKPNADVIITAFIV